MCTKKLLEPSNPATTALLCSTNSTAGIYGFGRYHERVIDTVRYLLLEFCNLPPPGAQAKPMEGLGSAGMFTVIRSVANDQDYNWGVRRGCKGAKRHDASVVPRLLTVLRAKNQV